MLQRISPGQVRHGMYVHGFGGSWLNHPFWRAKFLLTSDRDVERVRSADVPYVLIDDARGEGPEPSRGRTAPQPLPLRSLPRPARPQDNTTARRKDDSDRAQALALINRSKQMMRHVFNSARLGRAVRIGEVAPIVEDITASLAHNAQALLGVIRLKTKDEYTYFHSVAVCALMVNLARHMEMEEGVVREMGLAGLLHDIGKMGVPDAVLNKPDRLSEMEFATVREHPAYGHKLLSQTPNMAPMALDVCLHHHEKMDGTGYPFGLTPAEISPAARLGAICDVYDALTSDRAYKNGWTPVEAISSMWSWDGHFDRDLLFTFMQSIGVFPPGMLVRLRSNRLGMVLGYRKRGALTRACAFYSTRDPAFITPETVSIRDDFAGDRILGPEEPHAWGFTDWDAMAQRMAQGKAPRAAA